MIFKFPRLVGLNIGYAVFGIVAGLVIAALISRDDLHNAWIVAGIVGGFLLLLEYSAIVSLSSIKINDDGLSRSIGGITIQSISWSEVKRIKVMKLPGSARIPTRKVITVVRKSPGFVALTPKGKMILGDSMAGYGSFVRLLNTYVHRYNITVEIDDGLSIKVIQEVE